MSTANALGVKVALITTIVVLAIFGIFIGAKKLFFTPVEEPTLPSVNSPAIEAEDRDKDGLPDLIENIYKSDPDNPDTDGDGTLDGDEIALQRDPTLPGPNDQFSVDFITQSGIYSDTFTSRYLQTLPPDVSRQSILDKNQVAAFVEANKGILLPDVAVTIVPGEGKEVVQAYLEAISATHNTAIVPITSTDIDTAFRQHYTLNNPAPLEGIIAQLEQNVGTLENVAAPSEVEELHIQLVSASQALLNNSQLLQGIHEDFVGGLIGARNIEELGAVFQATAEKIIALEQQYEL
ncbi:MAG: hypothetical protein WD200_00965 [Candidatus Andersenbacteria bacterium]